MSDESKRRQLQVLIGESDENYIEIISSIVGKEMGDTCNLRFMASLYADVLLGLARNLDFDIFILFLNNIIFPSGNHPVETRLERSLQLVTNLRETCKKPVIALAGYPRSEDDPLFAGKAKLAGAGFFFQLPFKLRDFSKAVEKCLNTVA